MGWEARLAEIGRRDWAPILVAEIGWSAARWRVNGERVDPRRLQYGPLTRTCLREVVRNEDECLALHTVDFLSVSG